MERGTAPLGWGRKEGGYAEGHGNNVGAMGGGGVARRRGWKVGRVGAEVVGKA